MTKQTMSGLSEAFVSVLAGELPTFVWTTDPHLQITSCLGPADSLRIPESEDLIGRTVQQCFGVESSDAPIIAAHRHALRGEAISCDLQWRGRHLQAFVAPHRDQAGAVVGCSGIAREVTEQDREVSDLYRLFNLSQQILCVVGVDGYFKRVNHAFEKTLGSAPGDLLQRPALDFIHPDDRESTLREMEMLGERQASLSFENRYRCSDGSYRWLSWTSAPESDEGVLYATALDITERKRAEGLFRALLESAPDAVIVVDGSGQIVLINRTTERVFGYTTQELIGQPIECLIPKKMRGMHDDYRRRHMVRPEWKDMAGGRCLSACRRDGSEFPVEVRLSPVEVEDSKLIFAAVRDVSEREQMQQNIRENEIQLMAAHKIQQYLLPHAPPRIAGLDLYGVVLPANYAAGDQFDYLEMSDDTLGLVVGDVSGHGFSSALVMASTHELMRAAAKSSDDIGEMVTYTNEALCREVEESFVTMILARIDVPNRKLTYVNAGHPAGLLLDRDGNIKHQLRGDSLPLALIDDEQYAASESIDLEVGDVLLLMTDGVLEAGLPSQDEYGMERTIEAVRSYLQTDARQIVEGLCQAVRDYCDGNKFEDDVTVVVAKISDSTS